MKIVFLVWTYFVFDCYKTNPSPLVSPTIILHSTLGAVLVW